jgi:hypothetical protein
MAKYSIASDVQKAGMDIANKYYKDFSFYAGAETYPQNSDAAKIGAQIKQYYRNEIMKIVTGKPADVETQYNAVMTEMNKMGLNTLNMYYNDYFKQKKQLMEKYGK